MKILVVFTGGTISCSSENGVLSPDSSNRFLLLEQYKNNGGKAEFVTAAPYQILSENLTAENLEQLKICLKENITPDLDGVIVTHGTDTLQYTAAYLGYVFSKSEIPVVLVSANFPLADSRSNGAENFAAAAEFIGSGKHRGVYVSYKNTGEAPKIHRATRLLPHLPYDDRLFSLTTGKETADKADFSQSSLNGTVLYVKPCVGITYPQLSEKIKAVLLEGWHSGTLPTASAALKNFCENAAQKNIPVFLTGNTDGFEYESKTAFETLKIQALPPASPIAMYVKLWLCENTEDVLKPCGGDFAE